MQLRTIVCQNFSIHHLSSKTELNFGHTPSFYVYCSIAANEDEPTDKTQDQSQRIPQKTGRSSHISDDIHRRLQLTLHKCSLTIVSTRGTILRGHDIRMKKVQGTPIPMWKYMTHSSRRSSHTRSGRQRSIALFRHKEPDEQHQS